MNFRKRADMYICAPKVQLAHYVDLTMPKRDWKVFDRPAHERVRSRRPLTPNSQAITRQAG